MEAEAEEGLALRVAPSGLQDSAQVGRAEDRQGKDRNTYPLLASCHLLAQCRLGWGGVPGTSLCTQMCLHWISMRTCHWESE